MISYLVTEAGSDTLAGFLDLAAPSFRANLGIVTYRQLWQQAALGPATYIFSDLDRLDDHNRQAAAGLWRDLAEAHGRARLLNDPATVARRHDLLDLLHRQGTNRFRAPRAHQLPDDLRFPVFVRHDRLHRGSISPLLHSRAALDAWLARSMPRWLLAGHDPQDLLVVEYLDTADADGLFRKYAAFRVGSRILPRHVLFSREWEVKTPDVVDEALLREENHYLESNPHEGWLEGVFRSANIDYGRIDYGFFQGQPQVWEINLNPVVVPVPLRPDDRRLAVHRRFTRDLQEVLEAVDARPMRFPAPPVAVRPPLTRLRRRRLSAGYRRIVGRLNRRPLLRRLVRMVLALVPDRLLVAGGRLLECASGRQRRPTRQAPGRPGADDGA